MGKSGNRFSAHIPLFVFKSRSRSWLWTVSIQSHAHLERFAGLDRGGERSLVQIVEFAANRHAMGEAR